MDTWPNGKSRLTSKAKEYRPSSANAFAICDEVVSPEEFNRTYLQRGIGLEHAANDDGVDGKFYQYPWKFQAHQPVHFSQLLER